MNSFQKPTLEEQFIEAVLSVNPIDLLYNKDEKQPYLYKNEKMYVISIFIASILIALAIALIFFRQCDQFYMLASFLISQAVIFTCCIYLFYFLECKQIRKRMKSLNISPPSSYFDFRTSKSLSEMVLDKIYTICISKKLLYGNSGDSQILDCLISGYTKFNSPNQRSYKFRFLTFTVIFGFIGLAVGAFLGASYAYDLTNNNSLSIAWGITKLILGICFIILITLEYINFSIYNLKEDKYLKANRIHKILHQLNLKVIHSNNSKATTPYPKKRQQ